MKTRNINTDLLFQSWVAGVESLLFPDELLRELDPRSLIDQWDNSLPDMREKNRDDVDSLVILLLECCTPPELWSKLRETDPTLIALYYDRILAGSFALDQVRQQMKTAEIPESWEETISLLLLQKLFQ